MAEQQVNPVQGEAAQPHPGPAPIPRRQTRFRVAAPPMGNKPTAIPAFPVSEGIAPMIAFTDGYNSTEVPQGAPNTVLPSYLNCAARIFLTCQKLTNHDKFLKEVTLYHPFAFDLYCSFIFQYHTMLVRREIGNMSVAEMDLLSQMEFEYPVASLPVPGIMVDCLQAMTATENPYSWLGNVSTSGPLPNHLRGMQQGALLNHNGYYFYPNNMALITQIRARIRQQTHTNANYGNAHGILYQSDLATQLSSANAQRNWILTPHFRYAPTYSQRVEQQFYDQVAIVVGHHVNPAIFDLPQSPAVNNNNNGDLACYMGLTDYPGIAGRSLRFRRWPLQLANMVGNACKYISGSRFLSSINRTGLGATMHVTIAEANFPFEDRDPNVVHNTNPGAAHLFTAAELAVYHLQGLTASIEVRDPVASDLSIQYQMITQVNFHIDTITRSDGTQANLPANPNIRVGDFWDYPLAEQGPNAAVANIMLSHLPNLVRSNPRRDASE